MTISTKYYSDNAILENVIREQTDAKNAELNCKL